MVALMQDYTKMMLPWSRKSVIHDAQILAQVEIHSLSSQVCRQPKEETTQRTDSRHDDLTGTSLTGTYTARKAFDAGHLRAKRALERRDAGGTGTGNGCGGRFER